MALALHNGRVGRRVRRAGSACAAVVLLGCAGLVSACSGDSKGADPGDSSPSASVSGSSTGPAGTSTSPAGPTLPVPAGVELTPQGSQLQVGDTATVAWELRQGVVGVLDIKVTRLEKTSLRKSFVGWDLDQAQQNSNPYFVRVTVTNRGDTDLGTKKIPLYIVDGTNTLVESNTFESAFPPCEPGVFPKKFPTGKTLKACLVFLSPKKGDLAAVSFRPTQDFDPITWTGELEKPKPPKKAHKLHGSGSNQG